MAYFHSNTSKSPSVLEQLLEEINFQRTKEMRQLLKDGETRVNFSFTTRSTGNADNVAYLAHFRFWVCHATRNNILDGSFRKTLSLPERINNRL